MPHSLFVLVKCICTRMGSDDVNAARALMHGTHSVYSTLLLLIRNYGSTVQDNVKLTCERSGLSYFDAVWFAVVTRKRMRESYVPHNS